MTLPEILFTVQQLLSHPNLYSCAQAEAYHLAIRTPLEYSRRVKELVKKFDNASVVRYANMSDLDAEHDHIESKDVIEVAEQMTELKTTRERPIQPAFERDSIGNMVAERNMPIGRDQDGTCECSCCAWGQKFWDDQGRMRYLFGMGG